jgi:hypothetical protein
VVEAYHQRLSNLIVFSDRTTEAVANIGAALEHTLTLAKVVSIRRRASRA